MKKISLCMITYNKARFLLVSVPAILASISYKSDVEFLILNNGSTDDTPDVLKALSAEYKIGVMSVPQNIGLNGYSTVTEAASGDIIVTVDDDIFSVSRGWEILFDRFLREEFGGKQFGYVGSDTVNSDGGRIISPVGYVTSDWATVEVGPVGGWFAATTRNVMNQIGGFHSGKAEMHLEDADYQRRAWAHGYLCGTCLGVKVFHARAPRFYTLLDAEQTYIEKMELAARAGIEIEPI